MYVYVCVFIHTHTHTHTHTQLHTHTRTHTHTHIQIYTYVGIGDIHTDFAKPVDVDPPAEKERATQRETSSVDKVNGGGPGGAGGGGGPEQMDVLPDIEFHILSAEPVRAGPASLEVESAVADEQALMSENANALRRRAQQQSVGPALAARGEEDDDGGLG
jgi:hypothetical protein